MLIKFCGITRQEDATCAQLAGAGFCGFIFHPKSPRHIDPRAAAKIETGNMRRVGVFVGQVPAEITAIAKTARLDFAQLHGVQDADCGLEIPAIRVLWPARYANRRSMLDDAQKFAPNCAYFLLDAGLFGGGHGKSLAFAELADLRLPRPWFLAGGLGPENIEAALDACNPNGLDINSGVEDAPGIKNAQKMAEAASLAKRKKS